MYLNNKKIYLIAEVGVNHNGSIKIAKKLIFLASKAGFDAVKFQTWDKDNLLLNDTKLATYQKKNMKNISSQNQLLDKYFFNFGNFIELKRYASKHKIAFLSTPFDIKSADFLKKLKVPAFKISSGDNDNLFLLDHIKKFNKTIILSTGMINFKRLKETVKHLNLFKDKLILLHCVSKYPTNLDETQLGVINQLKNFGYPVGFSDHTTGFEASIAATAMGCCMIEKHITLNKEMEGPDHSSSLDSNDFKNFVKLIRTVKESTNINKRYISKIEYANMLVAKKSLYFVSNFNKNHVINENSFKLSRPRKLNSDPLKYKKILGKKLKKNVKKNSPIETS